MKKSISTLMSKLVFLFFVLMNATIAFAQDGGGTGGGSQDGGTSVTVSKSSSSTSTSTTEDWYTAPWVWVVGAAVFILLLIALIRGNSSRTDVHKTTVRKDITTD
jgi:hypothetical protein